MPNYVIADRRDLFGGRLIPMLNGLRMARVLGSKFLMTWHSDQSDFQLLVAGLKEVFAGEIVAPFDQATGQGTIIDINDSLVLSAVRDAEVLPTSDAAMTGLPDSLVRPIFSADPTVAYNLDRRFSTYLLHETDTPQQIGAELAAEFANIEKTPVVLDAFQRIDEYLPNGASAALHIRRLHLLGDTGLQINRFDSYCGTSMCHALIDSALESGGGRQLVASDCSALVADLKRDRSGTVVSIGDIIDLHSFTGMQQALIDLYFLSKASTIYGPKSAYGVVAAIIGGGVFRNLLIHVAENEIGRLDETGSIAFIKHQKHGRASITLDHFRPSHDHSALVLAVAGAQCWEGTSTDRSLPTALRAIALRFTQYGHASFFGDCPQYVAVARQLTAHLGAKDIEQRLTAIERALNDRSADELESSTGQPQLADGLANEAAILLDLIDLAVRMDSYSYRGAHEAAIGCFLRAITLASVVGFTARGLLLRIAYSFGCLGRSAEQMQVLIAAIDADPLYASSHFILAEALQASGKLDEARNHYHHATKLEPESGPFWYALGNCLSLMNELELSQDALKQALLCEPQNPKYAAAIIPS